MNDIQAWHYQQELDEQEQIWPYEMAVIDEINKELNCETDRASFS